MALRSPARLSVLGVVLAIGAMGAILLAEAGAGDRATVDEPFWITSSYLTWRLATQGAPLERWDDAFVQHQLGAWGNLNPPVAKYIVGGAVAWARTPADRMLYAWRWPYSYEENLAAGNLPPEHILTAGRMAIAILAVVCLGLLFWIARQLVASPWAALLAPALLFASQPFRWHGVRIYTDIPQLAFTLAGAGWVLVWLRRRRPWALPLGLMLLGLACGSKLSAGTAVVATAVFLAWVPGSIRARIARAAMAVAIPFATFIAINPFLWSSPLERTLWMLRGWSASIAQQALDPLHASARVTSLGRALRLLWSRVFWSPEHGLHAQGLEGALPHLVVVIATVVAGAVLGRILLGFASRRGLPLPISRGAKIVLLIAAFPLAWLVEGSTVLLLGLMVVGLVRLAIRLRGAGRFQGEAYFVWLLASTVVATVIWLPFDWARYYLPVLGWTPILATLGTDRDEPSP